LSNANNRQFYLLFLDLDNFKVANDTMGHEAGDPLLKLCAQRLKAVIHSDDQVCRVGGNEFAITLQSVDSPYDVEIICNRIIHAIAQKFVIESQEFFVGASIGAVQYANRNYSESTLIKNADIAMYCAKADGKNTYKFYSQSIAELKLHQQKVVSALQKSLVNDELEVYYQPIIDVDSGLMIGFDPLLRWNQPELGMVSPSVFIPIAENTGLVNPIGSFVIEAALRG
jgi:diguanylate cyclase (GGDEF)-like protein